MPSPSDLCNNALALLGSAQRIVDLTDRSKEAVTFSAVYQATLDVAFAATHWPFAKRVAALALTGTDVTDEFKYRYALPADCVRARYIVVPGIRPAQMSRAQKITFEIGADEDGVQPALFTDEANVKLAYTSNKLGPGTYPPLFAWAVSRLLAAAVAMPLTRDPKIAERTEIAAQRWLSLAAALLFAEGQLDQEAPPSSVLARQ